MRLPIDTNEVLFVCANKPEAVVDFQTKAPKFDEGGVAIYQVSLMAIAGDDVEVIAVKVPGEPKGLSPATPVKVIGLVATPWSMGDRSGVSFRAIRIDVARESSRVSS